MNTPSLCIKNPEQLSLAEFIKLSYKYWYFNLFLALINSEISKYREPVPAEDAIRIPVSRVYLWKPSSVTQQTKGHEVKSFMCISRHDKTDSIKLVWHVKIKLWIILEVLWYKWLQDFIVRNEIQDITWFLNNIDDIKRRVLNLINEDWISFYSNFKISREMRKQINEIKAWI